eukprot:1160429-Pelagomonas_calceolata.AAC.10
MELAIRDNRLGMREDGGTRVKMQLMKQLSSIRLKESGVTLEFNKDALEANCSFLNMGTPYVEELVQQQSKTNAKHNEVLAHTLLTLRQDRLYNNHRHFFCIPGCDKCSACDAKRLPVIFWDGSPMPTPAANKKQQASRARAYTWS